MEPTTHREAIPTGKRTIRAGRTLRVRRSKTMNDTTSEIAVDLS
jgi:hypothetical protein